MTLLIPISNKKNCKLRNTSFVSVSISFRWRVWNSTSRAIWRAGSTLRRRDDSMSCRILHRKMNRKRKSTIYSSPRTSNENQITDGSTRVSLEATLTFTGKKKKRISATFDWESERITGQLIFYGLGVSYSKLFAASVQHIISHNHYTALRVSYDWRLWSQNR